MKMMRLLGVLCISSAAFAMPAAAANADKETPATSGLCDDLADATPGLQGLCVAMCEAQTCEAEYNPDTGEIQFAPSCRPDAPRLLENYNRLKDKDKTDNDPDMPCVQVACPCWTQAELGGIGGDGTDGTDVCYGGIEEGYAQLEYRNGIWEVANASYNSCLGDAASFSGFRYQGSLDDAQYDTCVKTVVKECQSRGLLP